MTTPYEKALKRGFPALQFLTDTGLPDGNFDMGVLGSLATPAEFKITVPENWTYYLTHVRISLFSTTTQQLDGFGTLDELTNGIAVGIERRNGQFDQILPVNIRKICCVARLGGKLESLAGQAQLTHITASVDHISILGSPIRLLSGTSYVMKIQDDLSTLSGEFTTTMGYVRVKEFTKL